MDNIKATNYIIIYSKMFTATIEVVDLKAIFWKHFDEFFGIVSRLTRSFLNVLDLFIFV